MDEFLRDIHTLIFKTWILQQQDPAYQLHLSASDPHCIIIETSYSHSEITFHPLNIIELNVTNTTNDETEFYIHFQMNTLKHAVGLFQEMLDCIKNLITEPKVKVLLSCSSGFTTGLFAQNLNDAAHMLSLDYTFDAVPYAELFEVGPQYQIILLAPQISYTHAKVQEILRQQIVIQIPPQIFARYDAGKLFPLITEALKAKPAKHKKEETKCECQCCIHHDTKILSIILLRSALHYRLISRLCQNDLVLDDREVIKKTISLSDICDIIEVMQAQHPDLDVVGISMPGVIHHGIVDFPSLGFQHTNVGQILSDKYQVKVLVSNDANTFAVGFHAAQNQYHSLSVFFQPLLGYPGGVGSIEQDHLITGQHHLAGEVRYLPMNLSADYSVLAKTPEGNLELTVKTLISVMSILDPEAIIISSQMISQIDELKAAMTYYIPETYLPEMIKTEDVRSYMLLGNNILCTQMIEKKKQ